MAARAAALGWADAQFAEYRSVKNVDFLDKACAQDHADALWTKGDMLCHIQRQFSKGVYYLARAANLTMWLYTTNRHIHDSMVTTIQLRAYELVSEGCSSAQAHMRLYKLGRELMYAPFEANTTVKHLIEHYTHPKHMCQRAIYTWLLIFRRLPAHQVPKDVALIIARKLWDMRSYGWPKIHNV
jgi:hypothetical protein